MNESDGPQSQPGGTQVPNAPSRAGSAIRVFVFLVSILVVGFINGIFSRWLLGYFPLAVLIGFGPLIYVLAEAVGAAFIVRGLLAAIRPQLKISKIYLWIAIVVFAVIQLYMIFFVPDAYFNTSSYIGDSVAHSQIVLDPTTPVLVDGRNLELDGIHADGDQVIWSSHNLNSDVDDLSLFSVDLSSMTGESLSVANLSHAQGYLSRQDTGGEDTIVNGQIYYIDDGMLYHYDPSSTKSTKVGSGVVTIYGFDPASSLLILGSGSVVPSDLGGNYKVTQSNGIPDTSYNVVSGAQGSIPFPSSTLDMTKIIAENKPPFVQGSYIYYLTQFQQIARYNLDTNTNELLNIVPPRDVTTGHALGPISLIAANDRYLAYYYWPQDSNGLGREDYPALGIYDLQQMKIVFDEDFGSRASGIVGKFLGNDFYYSQEALGNNDITIRDLNLSSMQDVPVISLSDIVGGIATPGWDIGGGYVVYAQRQPSNTADDFGGELYFQKVTLSSSTSQS
jgi:hypothetical protein